MKTILIAVILFITSLSIYSQEKQYTFSAGDTVTTFSVSNADIVYFTVKDSSISGTDTLAIYYMAKSPISGAYIYTQVAVHDLGQTTLTTNVTVVSPGDNASKTYAITSQMWGGKITATFYIQRQNTRTGEAVYAAKTRLSFRYD